MRSNILFKAPFGSMTGEADHEVVPGGWAGTDDDTSTAPSDRMGHSPIMGDTARPENYREEVESLADRKERFFWYFSSDPI